MTPPVKRSEPTARPQAARVLGWLRLRLYFAAWMYSGAALLGGGWDLHPSGRNEIVGLLAGIAAGALLGAAVLLLLERPWRDASSRRRAVSG